MKLDKEKTKIWLKALRSGDYKQGQTFLRRTDKGVDSFCCMGVACDVLLDSWWLPKPLTYNRDLIKWEVDGQGYLLPVELSDRIGLSIERKFTLATMNDAQNKSFNQIADTIEAWMNDDTE